MNSLYRVEFSKWKCPARIIAEQSRKGKIDREDDDEDNEFAGMNEYHGPILQTNEGLFPLSEAGLFSSNYKLYKGQTNFNLGTVQLNILENLEGIEIMRVLTRYRFLVGIGQLFSDKDVLSRLKIKLEESAPKPALNNSLVLKESLSKQFKFFAIIKFDGKNQVISANSQVELDNAVEKFTKQHSESVIEYSSKNA